MPMFAFEGTSPTVHPDAWIAPTATLVGDVVVEANASVWYGVVIRGDFGRVACGRGGRCVLVVEHPVHVWHPHSETPHLPTA